jgi:hypothetical protein
MFVRSIIAVGTLCACAIPVLAQPVKPTVVVTAKALSQLLNEYREMIRQVGGPSAGDQLVAAFDEQIKEQLGENGFEGLDINRPLAAYAVVNEKFEETNPILILPITSEKEFIALLKRMKIEVNEVKDKKGLFMLRVRGLDFLPNDSFVQFVGAWAYVGLSGDEVGDPKSRLPIENLFENADLSLFTVKFFPGNFPQKLLKEWLDDLDKFANQMKAFAGAGVPEHAAKFVNGLFDEVPKLLRRYAETGIKEAQEIRLQFSWEANTGDTFTEMTLIPKAGSPLAKEIAAKAATTHRFAGLTHPNAAIAGLVKAPLFAKEVREILGAGVGALEGELKKSMLPEAAHPFLEELAKAATQSIKNGDLDLAFALVGPDKDGKFTVVTAMSIADTSAIDKALRLAAKDADLSKEMELDAAKVAGVSIHKVPFHRAFQDEANLELGKLFGDKPPGYIAFAKDAAFLSYGPEGLAAIKTAIEAKPGPAPVLQLTANVNRFHKILSATTGEPVAGAFAKLFGAEDKQLSWLRVTVEGGQTLKAKATLNVRYIPRLFLLD